MSEAVTLGLAGGITTVMAKHGQDTNAGRGVGTGFGTVDLVPAFANGYIELLFAGQRAGIAADAPFQVNID